MILAMISKYSIKALLNPVQRFILSCVLTLLYSFTTMMEKLVFQILFLCITKVVVVNNVSVARCPEVETACRCGSRPPYEIKYFPVNSWKYGNTEMDCIHMYSVVCETHKCSYNRDIGYLRTMYEGKKKRETVPSKESSADPIRVVYPPLDEEKHFQPETRLSRFPKTCNDPMESVKHATLVCTYWPEFISCEVHCSHGYAIEEKGNIVVNTTRNCRESGYWYPDAYFPVCKPYINCQAVLVKPGNLFCKTSGPVISYCDISCLADDSADEILEKRYECTDDNYAKTLPHCANLPKRVDLIKPPNFKNLHHQT